MRVLGKGIAVLAGVVALGSAMTGTAGASTTDFFPCPHKPYQVQISDFSVNWNRVVLESCQNPDGRTMYRGNIQDPIKGDALRIRYRDTGNFVPHSYRSSPLNDAYEWGARGVPGEWYYAAYENGYEIEACLDSSDNAQYRVCSY